MPGVKTRRKATSSVSRLVGTGREFVPSELPTARDVLRLAVLKRQQGEDRRNYGVDQLVTDVISSLLAQWQKANPHFTWPVTSHRATISAKIKKLWLRAVDISLGKRSGDKQRFMERLDNLLDILKCQCPIRLCAEFGCAGCDIGAHIDCRCSKAQKIPLIELVFVNGQRGKVGSVGPHQIGAVDRPESVRLEAAAQRLERQRVAEETRRKKAEEVSLQEVELRRRRDSLAKQLDCDRARQNDEDIADEERDSCTAEQLVLRKDRVSEKSDSGDTEEKRKEIRRSRKQLMKQLHQSNADIEKEPSEEVSHEDDFTVGEGPSSRKRTAKSYNTADITNIALASMRHHTGLRETAEIATAAWIDAGLISSEDTRLVIDHAKVKRAQEKVIKTLQNSFEEEVKEEGVSCLLFDGRRDETKVLLEAEESDRQFPGLVKEEHYSVCKEPGGKYLFHFVPEEGTKKRKHAEVIADHLVEWLKERRIEDCLQAIGGDSTNVNTGWEGGVMQHVETKLDRKLVWLVCDLHTGELSLRHLVTSLDGPTLSNNRWSGPVGKLLDTATELEINHSFTRITTGPPLIDLGEAVVNDLSTDQAYGYKIVTAIQTGRLPPSLALLEVGPVSHSRWLTTALRFCRLWISKHNLRGKALETLRLITEFVVGVYIPTWFYVKVRSKWVEGPRHILYQLECLRSQRKEVLSTVMPTVQRSAWYAHSEAVLQAMLCSDEEEERREAVERIIKLRGEGYEETQLGDNHVRPRRTPVINMGAVRLTELIDWSVDVMEPPLTCHITTTALKKFLKEPMEVPDWPSHTQSVERCVRLVTEAATHVYGHERRDGRIRSQVASRYLMPKNRSKKDLVSLVSFQETAAV